MVQGRQCTEHDGEEECMNVNVDAEMGKSAREEKKKQRMTAAAKGSEDERDSWCN